MRALLAAAALGLASMPATAQDTSFEFDTKVIQLPEGARPHDAAPGPAGQIWYTAQRQGALGIVDIASWTYRQVPLGEGSAPHGVVQGPDGMAWITGWNSGKLYRYRPSDQSWKTFALPGEKPQAYAVYVDERDDVWVTDFASNNTLVFDIATETWIATIPGSGPNAGVRQILGRGNEIYLPESGTNRLMLVTVGG